MGVTQQEMRNWKSSTIEFEMIGVHHITFSQRPRRLGESVEGGDPWRCYLTPSNCAELVGWFLWYPCWLLGFGEPNLRWLLVVSFVFKGFSPPKSPGKDDWWKQTLGCWSLGIYRWEREIHNMHDLVPWHRLVENLGGFPHVPRKQHLGCGNHERITSKQSNLDI